MSAPTLRRGLPRVPGGEPWPPVGEVPGSAASGLDAESAAVDASGTVAAGAAGVAAVDAAGAVAVPASGPAGVDDPGAGAAADSSGVDAAGAVAGIAGPDVAVSASAGSAGAPLRRGLPRVPGGEPWPPAGFAPAPPVSGAPAVAPAASTAPEASTAPTASTAPPASTALSASTAPEATARRRAARWALVAAGVVVAVLAVVLLARWLRGLEPVQAFLAEYPGEAPLPAAAPVGIPAWLGWQHFCNVFLMVLIVRSGLQVRRERRPAAYWASRRRPERKIPLNAWFHQSLDVLWLANGLVFVVLLAVTGQWMRIVPSDWAVVPNAASALLQYASLDWPVEHGWTNYNALQQLAYFATVFLAAPLAAVTGVRMSGWWPARAERLNRAYPIELARAIHFPVMLYFVAFVVMHVGLVFATGALRNLNHMYGGQDAVNWVGFAVFCASLLVIAAAWIAARPLVLAPIAGLFGRVSRR
ncbi:cytochrome b/b6 domain-containing protein [Agromyces archimandritae]|uniref:Cytochrome b/b6 domain-containing protein n=1 Tax=Agromyces archimandritae TaxID=2781962 RepID=A0A975FKK6_9MICO|nr:cytochrome b/b6 domain-containing protein [Agromyces archimandritae]QTX03789.1 cytochrome b/b6 domain-containing protein [Agromyces archimandritae]